MHIHTRKDGESIARIAERYGVWEEDVRQINDIGSGEAAVGEELLILIPTRSYTACHGDTLERIALRFGVPKRELISQNPRLHNRQPRPGERIALKYGERQYGTAVANGYFYKGCTRGALEFSLPYLTYVTFCSAVADRRNIRRTNDDRVEVTIANREGKIPLLRVYDRHPERFSSGENPERFAEEMITIARNGDYKGIVLDTCRLGDSAKDFCAFLMVLRKMMIGCDLILITEINGESPIEYSEYADGSVMYYPKYALQNPPDKVMGERRILSDFACRGESAKTFIDLPSVTRYRDGFITYGQAMRMARREGLEIVKNESTLLSHLTDRKQGECVFSPLSGVRYLLDLAREFDYMGICFDIMRSPLSHLMMYNTMFKTHYYNSVRTREGCSHGGEE